MKNPNTIEAEVDAIRDKLWEETKHMTPKERDEFIHRRVAPIIEQYHIKVTNAPMHANQQPQSAISPMM